MTYAAQVAIAADRYTPCVRTVTFRGLDLTGVALRMQARLRGDTPGLPLFDLQNVSNAQAQGLKLVSVDVTGGYPVSVVQIRINETTIEGLPYSGELGDATAVEYDMQGTMGGDKRVLMRGVFSIGAGVTGADNAPLNRPFGYTPSSSAGGMRSGAILTFGETRIDITIDGADLIAPLTKRATDAAASAEQDAQSAEMAAQTALAASRYFATRAAGETGSTTGQLFSTKDGAGNLIYYEKNASGSYEIARAVTPSSLAVAGGSAMIGTKAAGSGAVARTLEAKTRESISVLDFGAVGDGITDDWAAFNAAVLAAQSIVQVNGANVAVAAEIVVPHRAAGYVLGSTLNLYPGIVLRFLSGSQIITKTHANDMYLLKGGAQIIGGDHRGALSGSLAGHCFRFENSQGRQRLIAVKADTGWADEVVYYDLEGGSQSALDNCTLTAGSGKFAVKVADGTLISAVPRKVTGLQTNGGLGIDFGACNDFFVSDSFVGGLRFTDDSRGVHTTGLRVANQSTLEIRGHNHVIAGGFNPIPTFKGNSDVIVWNAYCNSGRPIDETGNTRNNINFAESAVIPILRSDANALTLASYRNDWGVKRSGATYTFRLDVSCSLAGGTAAPGGLGLGFLYIDMPAGCFNYGAEQPVNGLWMTYTVGGVTKTSPIAAIVQSVGGNNRMQLYDMNMAPITGSQAPGGVSTPGWVLTRIRGQINYSPA